MWVEGNGVSRVHDRVDGLWVPARGDGTAFPVSTGRAIVAVW